MSLKTWRNPKERLLFGVSFLALLWIVAAFISAKPVVDVSGYYTCDHGNKECYEQFHGLHLLSVARMRATTTVLY